MCIISFGKGWLGNNANNNWDTLIGKLGMFLCACACASACACACVKLIGNLLV